MNIRISHYGTSNIFQKQDGPNTYSSFKRRLGRGTKEIAGPKGINQRTEEKETLMRLITPA